VDIKITCRACERTYPLEMTYDPEGRPGHCPMCGEVLAFQYSATYVEVAQQVQALADSFTRQLTLFAELAGGFEIDKDSVLRPVTDALGAQDSLVAEPYRPGWPPRPSEPVT
jgi:hypothetical protein